jgi:hypothetical protein
MRKDILKNRKMSVVAAYAYFFVLISPNMKKFEIFTGMTAELFKKTIRTAMKKI